MFFNLKGLTSTITTRLVLILSVSILITAGLGFLKVYQVTEINSEIRIDRAARAATGIFTEKLASEYSATRDSSGRPLTIKLKGDTLEKSLTFRDEHDALLKEIGSINQGAANLFKLNLQSKQFDRFATTFRRPNGSLPPPMSIGAGHPAFADLINNRSHIGEVPVMGRMRLAYLIPIQAMTGAVAGALAVDVGWVDDLVSARDELRIQFIVAALIIVALATIYVMRHLANALKPLRELATFSDELAAEAPTRPVPHKDRKDEIGALAQGLEKVVALHGKLAHLAYTDELTGLGNRSRYISDLVAALKYSPASQHSSALLHLDLDNFRQINDAFGQKAGYELLKEVAARISNVAQEKSKIARLSSDQFTILAENMGNAAEVNQLAQNVLKALRQPFPLAAGEIHITASIGINLLQFGENEMDEVHRNASLALRKAKADGGDQALFFGPDMRVQLQDQVRMDRNLQAAIKNREITIHFQPQIIPGRKELAGVEALARWTHPNEGEIPPARFIPIAEASGQIVGLGELVLDLACEQAAKWRQENFEFKHIAVNVSPIQLWQSNFVDILKNTLERHNLSGQYIYVEITESVFVDHDELRILSVLQAIQALGVKLSLDDFGAGYSSLGYLNRLPIDQLKIDRSFVSAIDTDLRKQKVLEGVLQLASSLGFDIVIEGAETFEEVEVIQAMGCGSIQGFFYSKPAPATQIPEILRKIALSNHCRQQRSA